MDNHYILTTVFNQETHALFQGPGLAGACYMIKPLRPESLINSGSLKIVTRGTEEEMNKFLETFLGHIDTNPDKSSPEEIEAHKSLKTEILGMSVYSRPAKQESPFFYSMA